MIDTSCSIGKVFLRHCSDAKGEKRGGKGIRISFPRVCLSCSVPFLSLSAQTHFRFPQSDDEQKYMALTVYQKRVIGRENVSLRFKIIFRVEREVRNKSWKHSLFAVFDYGRLKWFRQNPPAGITICPSAESSFAPNCCLRAVRIIKNKLHLAHHPLHAQH